MARTSSSDKGSFLDTLMNVLRDLAANVILAVLVLGSLYARLFEALLGARELSETPDRQAHISSTCNDDIADVCIDSNSPQECTPGAANVVESNGHSLIVPSTPADQILFSGIGPTPQAPLVAHPVARTLPAPSTAEPSSPSANLLPRNLDTMLLAVADCQDAADGPKGYAPIAANVWARNDVANPFFFLQDYLQEPQIVSNLTFSTPPPALPLTPLSDYDKLDKSVSVAQYPAAPTIPRKAPGVIEMINGSPLSTPLPRSAIEDGVPFFPAVKDVDVDYGDGPGCTIPTASGARTGCALGGLPLEPLAHNYVDVGVHEDNTKVGEENSVNTEQVICGLTDSVIDTDAAAGCDEINYGHVKAELQQTEHQLEMSSGGFHLISLTIPAVELPATPASSGLDDMVNGDGTDVVTGSLQASWQDVYAGDEDDNEEVSAAAIFANTLEVPDSSGLEEHLQDKEGQPLLEDHESLQSQDKPDAGVANTVREPSRTSGTLPKSRSTPSPKQQTRKSIDAFSGRDISAAATPRITVRSPKLKRSGLSPNATAITATPATARRPVGPDPTGLRSPPPGSGEKRRVVRRLNTTSPKADTSLIASSRGVVRKDGSISPGNQPVADCSSASGGAIPRYAAPTAASIARKAPSTSGATSPQQQLRLSSTQRLSLSTAVPSIAAESVRSDGASMAPGNTRKTNTDAKVRAIWSAAVS